MIETPEDMERVSGCKSLESCAGSNPAHCCRSSHDRSRGQEAVLWNPAFVLLSILYYPFV